MRRELLRELPLWLTLALLPAGLSYGPSVWPAEGLRAWPRAVLLLCMAAALVCLVLLRAKTPVWLPWALLAASLLCALPVMRSAQRLAPAYSFLSLDYLRRALLVLIAALEMRRGRACLACGCGAGVMWLISAACFLAAGAFSLDHGLNATVFGCMFAVPAYMIYRQLNPKE